MARPFGKEGNTEAALKGGRLTSAQGTGIALIPGAVIAGEAYERVVGEAFTLERADDLADAPVDLSDAVTDVAELCLAAEALRAAGWLVWVGEREVEEEGIALTVVDVLDGLLGVDEV